VPIVTGETYMSVRAAMVLGLVISLVTLALAEVWRRHIRPHFRSLL